MNSYEKELLALAWDTVLGRGGSLTAGGTTVVASKGDNEVAVYTRDTLNERLTALLRDLGVEVPEESE